jgi:DsbC/DsbD-like thiol-disulfide interchange protein
MSNKRILILTAGLLVAGISYGQTQSTPVHFAFHAERTGDKTYRVHLTATLDPGWHIYAQVQPKSAISVPTKIAFTRSPLVILDGNVVEKGARETQTIKEAGIEQYMYEKTVDFVQMVKIKAEVKTTLTGSITYQVCTDKECLRAATVPFSISIP